MLPGSILFLHLSFLPAITEDKVADKAEAQWYDGYPAVKSLDVPLLSCSDLLGMMNSGASPGQDFILVDLRRNDHMVCGSRCPRCTLS